MEAVAENKDPAGLIVIQKIKDGNEKVFEELFFQYYGELCALASKITKSTDRARDVVQEVFLHLWQNSEAWQIKTSLKAYLYKAVWNEALKVKTKQKNRHRLVQDFAFHESVFYEHVESCASVNSPKLIERIWHIVEGMANQRRFVFVLHRKHGLSYKEIARVMGISRKTVENHMGLALNEIRESIDPELLS